MKKCEKCNSKLSYNEKWDSYYCYKCNVWTEKQCDDPKCFYCPNRPEKPVNFAPL